MSEHMVQLMKPMYMRVPVTKLSFKVASTANKDGTIDIAVSSDKVYGARFWTDVCTVVGRHGVAL
jgi:hypothetical protein